MAIQWGGTVSTGTQSLRLGIDMTYTGNPTTGTVVLTVSYWMWASQSINDDCTLNASGVHGNKTHDFRWVGPGQRLITTYSVTLNTRYGTATTYVASANVSGVYNGLVPSVSRSIKFGARQYEYPNPPPSLSYARASDKQINVSWTTAYTGALDARPWTGVKIERWDTVSNKWTQVATLGWSVTSWQDKTVTANNRYEYRIRSYNTRGHSGYTRNTDRVSTSPATPTNVAAKKTAAGDIQVTWYNASRVGTSVDIWGSANGGAWTLLKQVTSWTPLTNGSWTHASPDTTKTWKYRLRHYEADGGLYSPWSAESNTVQLLCAPLAPTELAPTGALDASVEGGIFLSWRHNPQDTTDQEAYEIQWRVSGDAAWTSTGKISSAGATAAPTPFVNGNTYEWQVRTWGQYASPSPWSTVGIFTTSTPPQVLVVAPGADEVLIGSTGLVEWSYHDDEGKPQAAWKVTLYGADGDVVHTYSATDEQTLYELPVRLANGGAYTVEVEVRDSDGLWSEPASSAFSVEYAEPPTPEVVAEWDASAGAVQVTITVPPYAEGEQVPAEYLRVYRQIDDGTEVLIADNVPPDTAVTDYLPAFGRVNTYRVEAYSTLPSSSTSEPTPVDPIDGHGWVFINAGPGFGTVARLRDNVDLSEQRERAKTLKRFAGRRFPVEYVGEARTHTLTVQASIGPDTSTVEEVEAVEDLGGVVLYRDATGRRFFASMSGVSSTHRKTRRTVSFTLTEVDYAE